LTTAGLLFIDVCVESAVKTRPAN